VTIKKPKRRRRLKVAGGRNQRGVGPLRGPGLPKKALYSFIHKRELPATRIIILGKRWNQQIEAEKTKLLSIVDH